MRSLLLVLAIHGGSVAADSPPPANPPAEAAAAATEPMWAGHKLKAGLGSAGVVSEGQIAPVFELGYEYGTYLGPVFIACDLGFTAFYPETFRPANITLFGEEVTVPPPWQMAIPVVHLSIGWDPTPTSQVLLGSAYVWGLNVVYRKHIADQHFWELQAIWFLDRLIFDQGLHDAYATISYGYRL